MKYTVTNKSTDVTLYPTAINGNQCSMIRPGESRIVDAKAKDELVLSYPEHVTVVGTTDDPHAAVTINKVLTASWELLDLGYYYGTINIKAEVGTVNYSFSGFTGPATDPPIDTIGTLVSVEDVTLFITTKPQRYVYVKGGTVQITAS